MIYLILEKGAGNCVPNASDRHSHERLWERPNAEADVVAALKIPLLFFMCYHCVAGNA